MQLLPLPVGDRWAKTLGEIHDGLLEGFTNPIIAVTIGKPIMLILVQQSCGKGLGTHCH